MGKFSKNAVKANINIKIPNTMNKAGGHAFSIDDVKTRLASRVMTSFIGEDKFYGDNTNEIIEDIYKCAETDPVFILKLAAYARNVMNMRSSPILLLALSSMIDSVKPFIKNFVPKIVKRADEPVEIIALLNDIYGANNKKLVLPNSLKKGIANSLNNFNEYNLTKYNRKSGGVNLYDVFNMCHPKPRNEKQAIEWKRFMSGESKPPETWEVELSKNTGEKKTLSDKKADWEKIIPKMGYMALLRNIRNFIETGVDGLSLRYVVEYIANSDNVINSKQLPFRFYSAYNEIEKLFDTIVDPKKRQYIRVFLDVISNALDIAVKNNVPKFDGSTAIICDFSGSMDQYISNKSSITYKNICTLFGAIVANNSDEYINIAFASDVKILNDKIDSNIIKYMKEMSKINVGGSTYAYKAFDLLLNRNLKFDRVILISDMQCYGNSPNPYYVRNDGGTAQLWEKYSKKYSKAFLHSIDLAGYGTQLYPNGVNNVALYYGWSEKLLSAIPFVEKGVGSFIDEIEKYDC